MNGNRSFGGGTSESLSRTWRPTNGGLESSRSRCFSLGFYWEVPSVNRKTVTAGLAILITVIAVGASDAASPQGRWSGTWTSESTGHRGTLKARIRQVDANTYRAIFMGRFAKVIPFV